MKMSLIDDLGMAERFVLAEDPNKKYLIVVGTSYMSAVSVGGTLLFELRSRNYGGYVLFDVALSNGLRASNRFIEMCFSEGKFDVDSAKVVDEGTRFLYHKMCDQFIADFVIDYRDGVLNSDDISYLKSLQETAY